MAKMRKLNHAELVQRQAGPSPGPRLPLVAVLNNIRSLHNVGSMFRTADGAGVEKLWLTGITGHPPQAALAKTALGAQLRVPWDHADDAVPVVRKLRDAGYRIVLLEQTDRSRPYQTFVPEGPVCLVLGNEVEGVGEALLPWCDEALEIEMAGEKNSLNVAVAFGIAAYHIRTQLLAAGRNID